MNALHIYILSIDMAIQNVLIGRVCKIVLDCQPITTKLFLKEILYLLPSFRSFYCANV